MGAIRWVPCRVLDVLARKRSKPLSTSKASALRSQYPIVGYIGANGSGKSLAAVRDTVFNAERFDRPILSNLRILGDDGGDHELWRPLTKWQELATFAQGEILLDEVQGIAGSRGYASLPPQVFSGFLQLRKRGCTLRWTTTTYARVDMALREVTAAICICRSSHGNMREAEPGNPWVPRKRFLVSMLDVAAMESAEASLISTGGAATGLVDSEELAKPLHVERRWRRASDRVLYSTIGQLGTMNHTDTSGLCFDCGGKRALTKCSCGQVHLESEKFAEAPTSVGASTFPPPLGANMAMAPVPAEAIATNRTSPPDVFNITFSG